LSRRGNGEESEDKMLECIKILGVGIIAVSFFASTVEAEECTPAKAMDQAILKTAKKDGETARETLPLLKELQILNAKATIPGKPIGEQLSVQDASRFAKLSARLSALQLARFIESNRSRDIRVIRKMVDTAEQLYLGKDTLAVIGKDMARSLVPLMRMSLSRSKITIDGNLRPSECSVKAALERLELDAAVRTSSFLEKMKEAISTINSLKGKYGIPKNGPTNTSTFSSPDKRNFEQAKRDLTMAKRETGFITDLENIRSWWAAADTIYRTRKEDMVTYGASMKALGRTLQSRSAEHTDREKIMFGLWTKVNEKVPSDHIEQLKALSK
jgi:hypothetical protein